MRSLHRPSAQIFLTPIFTEGLTVIITPTLRIMESEASVGGPPQRRGDTAYPEYLAPDGKQ